jgi:hypothetical protein
VSLPATSLLWVTIGRVFLPASTSARRDVA